MTLWSVFSQHNSNIFLENNISERARNFTEDLNSLWPDSQRGKGWATARAWIPISQTGGMHHMIIILTIAVVSRVRTQLGFSDLEESIIPTIFPPPQQCNQLNMSRTVIN